MNRAAHIGLVAVTAAAVLGSRHDVVGPPSPYGPVPSQRQLRWHELEYCGFLHFGVDTFTDREWGNGDEPASAFAPSAFDADQIAGTAAESGMRGLILTAKHHDGFCLWPSRYASRSVAGSPWQGGKGDVVRAVADACRRHGLAFGVYLSPWDRGDAAYGRPEYVTRYRGQLRELLTGYGPLFEVWFDGANGGFGFYGGAREERKVDRATYYGWPATWQMVRDLQPGACIFSDAGPDVRWVGNERGEAGDPCWATLDPEGFAPGVADEARLNRGDRPGTRWLPAECDVSIRPGWFHHPSEDGRVKTAGELLELYFASVGRGASLLLNIPPDRRGQVPEDDARRCASFAGCARRPSPAISHAAPAPRRPTPAAAPRSSRRGGRPTVAATASGRPTTASPTPSSCSTSADASASASSASASTSRSASASRRSPSTRGGMEAGQRSLPEPASGAAGCYGSVRS
jgi:alpha-L-fucosidase